MESQKHIYPESNYKYYLYIVNNQKSILLSSSNSKTELRELALEKIGEKIKKYNGLYLYRVKISKVSKKDINNDKTNKIKLIGGPYVATIQKIQINIINTKNSQPKLKNVDDKANKIYFSNKYFKKYNSIQKESINKMIFDFTQNKFNNNVFAVNTINK